MGVGGAGVGVGVAGTGVGAGGAWATATGPKSVLTVTNSAATQPSWPSLVRIFSQSLASVRPMTSSLSPSCACLTLP